MASWQCGGAFPGAMQADPSLPDWCPSGQQRLSKVCVTGELCQAHDSRGGLFLSCASFSSWCLLCEKGARWLRCHPLRGYSQVYALIGAYVFCLLARGAPALVREQGLRLAPLFPLCRSLQCPPGHGKGPSPGYGEAGGAGALSFLWGV